MTFCTLNSPWRVCPAFLGSLSVLTTLELFRWQLTRMLLTCVHDLLWRVLGLLPDRRTSLVVITSYMRCMTLGGIGLQLVSTAMAME